MIHVESLFDNTLARTLMCVVCLVCGLYWYSSVRFKYWKHLGSPYEEPQFFFGSLKELITHRVDVGRAYQRIYNRHRKTKFVGAFHGYNPLLIIIDTELIKFVLTKGFQCFTDRGNLPKIHSDFLQNNLFNMEGEEWRQMRKNLTPTFTSVKLKNMFSLMQKTGKNLTLKVDKLSQQGAKVDFKDLMSRFTSDIIASCAYGLEVNSMLNPDEKFYQMAEKMFISGRLALFKRTFLFWFPKLFNFMGMKMTNRAVEEYLPGLVKETIAYRKETKVSRGDFLDILLNIGQDNGRSYPIRNDDHEFENHTKENETVRELTLEEMSGQTFIFFMAGFETAATTLTFCLYELARRPKIQDRLRAEILQVQSDEGVVSYESLHEMIYMEQVINETLRLYASLPVLTRICVEPTRLPGTDLVVDKEVKVIIPTFAIHHDPLFYPDPETFDPDRFTEQCMSERHPYTHLPFGEGPRMCIGMRFGKMQIKVGLCSLLPKFQFALAPGTPEPMPISKASLVTKPAFPVNLVLTKIE